MMFIYNMFDFNDKILYMYDVNEGLIVSMFIHVHAVFVNMC